MTKAEIEALLQEAFSQCEAADCSLNDQQKQILLRVAGNLLENQSTAIQAKQQNLEPNNPLDELSAAQRQALLQFVAEQDQSHHSWKIKLFDDWLHNRDSGSVQFIRELYGPQWLQRVRPSHLAKYAGLETSEVIRLKVGDRIEVCNGLWEWVQQTDPTAQEWFPCIIVGIKEQENNEQNLVSCTIRFDDGTEYEIQGIYDWNWYYWRWPEQ